MTRTFYVAILVVAVFSVSPAMADSVDQSMLTENTGTACFSCTNFAQTFTAGVTGTLTGVNIQSGLGAAGPYVLSINTVSGGLPTGTVLASVPLAGFLTYGISTFIALPDVPILAGTQYAIVLSAPTVSFLQWNGNVLDQYAGGSAYMSSDLGVTWSGASGPVADFAFQTWVADEEVAPVPEPGSMLLLGSGIVAVWLRKRRG